MWLGGGEDGVMTWYNPSISIIEEAEDNSGVNIWPKNKSFIHPCRTSEATPISEEREGRKSLQFEA